MPTTEDSMMKKSKSTFKSRLCMFQIPSISDSVVVLKLHSSEEIGLHL